MAEINLDPEAVDTAPEHMLTRIPQANIDTSVNQVIDTAGHLLDTC